MSLAISLALVLSLVLLWRSYIIVPEWTLVPRCLFSSLITETIFIVNKGLFSFWHPSFLWMYGRTICMIRIGLIIRVRGLGRTTCAGNSVKVHWRPGRSPAPRVISSLPYKLLRLFPYLLRVVTKHCESFSRTCLPIHKYGSVNSFQWTHYYPFTCI